MSQGIRTKKQLYAYLSKYGVNGEKELAKGIMVEYEHTKSTPKATRIAMDHLVEFPRYYMYLDAMEKSLELEKKTGKKCDECCGHVIESD